MITVWQRSRRRLKSALVSAGLPRKSCQAGYIKLVVIIWNWTPQLTFEVGV